MGIAVPRKRSDSFDAASGLDARIRRLRTQAGLSQAELAAALGVGRSAVANWEAGRTRPDIACLPALCTALRVSVSAFFAGDAADPDERSLLRVYRSLGPEDRHLLLSLARTVSEHKRPPAPAAKPVDLLLLPFAEDAVAAGTADYGIEGRCEPVYVHSTPLTRRADMLFRVNGTSMAPVYPDHCIVALCRGGSRMVPGDVGVFQADGALYMKEYREDGLHSFNPAFPTMAAACYDEIRAVGRVIGILDEDDIAAEKEIAAYRAGGAADDEV